MVQSLGEDQFRRKEQKLGTAGLNSALSSVHPVGHERTPLFHGDSQNLLDLAPLQDFEADHYAPVPLTWFVMWRAWLYLQ